MMKSSLLNKKNDDIIEIKEININEEKKKLDQIEIYELTEKNKMKNDINKKYTILFDFHAKNKLKESINWKINKAIKILKIEKPKWISKLIYKEEEVVKILNETIKDKIFYEKKFDQFNIYFLSSNSGFDVLIKESNNFILYNFTNSYFYYIFYLFYTPNNETKEQNILNKLKSKETNISLNKFINCLESDGILTKFTKNDKNYKIKFSFIKTKGSNCYRNLQNKIKKFGWDKISDKIYSNYTKKSFAIFTIIEIYKFNFIPADLYSCQLFENGLSVCTYFK
jgi:hypothetical protein